MERLIRKLTLVVALAGLAACGGGGETVETQPPPSSSTPTPIVAVGPISNFGSIVVNGVRYNTDNASFSIDGVNGTQSDLSVGHVVSVSGSVNSDGTTGTANQVMFDDLVKGPVHSIDTAASTLVVLGQAVLVTAGTSFDDDFSPSSLDGVSVGQIVEVSGQFDGDGNVVASRIEPKPAGTQYEVHGTVSALDTVGMTFQLNALVVDYSAAVLDDFPNGMIADGDFVEAKGTTLGASGELLASKVELESAIPGADDGDYVEVEGYITRFESIEDFDVGMQPVTTTSATRYEDGSASDLGLNVKVEVEGRIDSNGVLVADEVEIERAKAVRISANVDSTNSAANSVVMLGIAVKVDSQTRMEDKSDAEVSSFGIADVNAGDYVEARGTEMPAGSGEVLAARFEREDSDEEAILQGFVESIDGTTLRILGVTIETNSGTEFEDDNGTYISSTEFFSRLTIGSLVKAKGAEVSDTTIVAREVEFETES